MGADAYQPVALSVGAIVCIAAANAGATSQDLKTGFLVGATPIRQQLGLIIGVLVSVVVIGFTVKFLHESFTIGSEKFPAPQATLMATVIKGVLSQNLPWGYILVGCGLAVMVHLCGVSPLAWAVGAYLPIGTTMPIFIGGMLRALADKLRGEKGDSELSPGMLYATGLVAGATLTGVASSVLKAIETGSDAAPSDLLTDCLSIGEHFQTFIPFNLDLFALLPYTLLAIVLVRIGSRKTAV
jgi:putative OPT family oligopeptide transporter